MADFLGLTTKDDPIGDALRQRAQPSGVVVNLTALSAAEKRRVWEHLKATKPDLAALLLTPALEQLRQIFGEVAVHLPADLVKAALHDPQ